MVKLIIAFSILFITGCKANESLVDHLNPKFDSIYFDVVQKQLVINQELPNYLKNLISQWFNDRVKISGFDGDLKFIISEYSEEVSMIKDGKKVQAFLSFKILINKPSFSQKKIINGKVSSYGTLTGNFSLDEFDTVIQNTQSDLVLRLSHDLKSKI